MINWDRIAELTAEVGEDDFAEVVDLFCEEVAEALAELDRTPEAQPQEKLHFIKGSALNIGFAAVSQLCLAEEARLRADPDCSPHIAPIRQAFEAARAELLG